METKRFSSKDQELLVLNELHVLNTSRSMLIRHVLDLRNSSWGWRSFPSVFIWGTSYLEVQSNRIHSNVVHRNRVHSNEIHRKGVHRTPSRATSKFISGLHQKKTSCKFEIFTAMKFVSGFASRSFTGTFCRNLSPESPPSAEKPVQETSARNQCEKPERHLGSKAYLPK